VNDTSSPPAAPRPEPPPRASARSPRRAEAGREITLRGLATTLAGGWWLLVLVTILCVVAAGVALKMRTPAYTATLVVAPAERDLGAASRLAADLEQYAALATLAQTPTRMDQVSPLERYVELLGSTALAARLEEEHGLLRRLFADQWDEASGTWRPPAGLLAAAQRRVREFFGFPGWSEPDPPRLAEWLRSQIRVTRPGGIALRRLELAHPDPALAVELLALVHATADGMLREQALARVRRQVAHLESELADAGRAERRDALAALLADQYRVEALLEADLPFAAEVVSPAAASSEPTSPGPALILSLAAFVGLVLGLFVVFLRDALRLQDA
jgi:uncharacterized protein involved in exopolysaccharide biosynthesis